MKEGAPEKPKSATIINFAEKAQELRDKRENSASEKNAYLKTVEETLRDAFESPEAKRRFPGINPSMILQVFRASLLASQEEGNIGMNTCDLVAKGMSDSMLAISIRTASAQGISNETSHQYVSNVEEILFRVSPDSLPPL